MKLSRIIVYPIKSLDGVSVSEVRITCGGALENDRTWAILDGEGRTVNAKRFPHVQRLRSVFSPDFREVEIGLQGEVARKTFSLVEVQGLTAWLSSYLEFPVTLARDNHLGFPDDHKAWGPTIISEGTLKTVADWFPNLPLDNMRRRFRTNLELDAGEPFWEDRLFGAPDQFIPFKIGAVHFSGHNPCGRCPVPARDPDLGTADPLFQAAFSEKREKEFPSWANRERFNHYYRLSVNTSIDPSQAGFSLRLGDTLQIS